MKESLKKVFKHSAWKHILRLIGVFAVFEWVVFPSLTAPSTIFNVFGLLVAAVLGVFVGVYIKEEILNK